MNGTQVDQGAGPAETRVQHAFNPLCRALAPLWRDLVDFAPTVQFDDSSARRLSPGRGDIADRIRHRLTEINDVLVGPLQPYLDPAVHAAARDETPVKAEHPVAFTPPDVTDIRDEAAWLATVAEVYADLPITKEQPRHVVARAR